jgi:hypothetical protein
MHAGLLETWAHVVVTVCVAILICLLGLLIIVVIRDSIRRKHKWGSYLTLPQCVRCGERGSRQPVHGPGDWSRLVCNKCGFVSDGLGVPVTDWPPPAPWIVLPATDKPRPREEHPEGVTAPETRIRVPSNGYHEGRHA